jgi:hypothetical protein
MFDMRQQNLGKKCRYASNCPIFQGVELPPEADLIIWRNVFCYRGLKGWSNCKKYQHFENRRLESSIKYK